MGTPSIQMSPWKIVLRRMFVDIGIGVTIGALIWLVPLARDGRVVEALKGNVEDSISLLQGLATIGAMVGGLVGIVHGVAAVGQMKTKNEANDS